MSLNHGINTKISDTDFVSVTTTPSGIPIFFGAAPVHTAAEYDGDLVLVRSFAEAERKLGYVDSGWETWTLCEAMFGHLKLSAMAPAFFCNVFDPKTHKKSASAAEFDVSNHSVTLPEYIADASLVIKNGQTVVEEDEYDVSYDGTDLIVTLKSGSANYSATTLNVAGNQIDKTKITTSVVETAIEKIEGCKAKFGVTPDLLLAPKFSRDAEVAQLLAAKAAAINGLFRGKAIVDLPSDDHAAEAYDDVHEIAQDEGYTDKNMIVCWPEFVTVGSGDGKRRLHFSTVLAGKIASVDAEHDGIPVESPSNKALAISGAEIYAQSDAEVNLTVGEADVVSISSGVVTALNFDGWRTWGNYTACRTVNENDPAKVYICCSRMMDYICNVFVNTFWDYVDRPLTSVLVDAVVNNFNAWLGGLTANGALLGGEIAYVADNNPTADLLAGKFRLDTRVAAPVPAQQIDMVVEFDADLLVSSLNV